MLWTQLLGEVLNAEMLERLSAEHPDVRYAHGFLFQQLVEGPRPVGEMAENLGVTSQAISKTVRELEGARLRRARGRRRRTARVRRVALTARGRAVLEAGRAIRARAQRRAGRRHSARSGCIAAAKALQGRARGARCDVSGGVQTGTQRSRPPGRGPMTLSYGFRSRSRAALPHRGRGLRPPPEGPLVSADPSARPPGADRRHRAPVPRGHAPRLAQMLARPGEGRGVRGRERGRLLLLRRGPRPLPRQRLPAARLDLDRHARHPGHDQVRRRARAARGGHQRWPTRSAGSSCSPAPPAPASRPRSRR